MEGHKPIKNFVIDCDGCLTDGKFTYTAAGKVSKVYGPDDSDALDILKRHLNIFFVSGDRRGFAITQKRVADMKFSVELVSTFDRLAWIRQKLNPVETIFMGDGIYDVLVFPHVAYSIAPANGFYLTRDKANFVTQARGGEGAVAEACLHILEKFFGGFDLAKTDFSKGSGAW